MSRKTIPQDIQTNVLVKSRRRCCICFGLNRDTALKPGQIAHLDKNNSNNSEENLAFLCLHHHDEYDSKTSQRKNITINEVKSFRAELQAALNRAFSLPVHFGELKISPTDPYAGQYIRIGHETNGAEITLTPVPDNSEEIPRYFISGFAQWGMHKEYGPNIGELSSLGVMWKPDELIATNDRAKGIHTIRLIFNESGMKVEEDNWRGYYGQGVNFIGDYVKGW